MPDASDNTAAAVSRRGVEPPVPTNFGTPDARWLPGTDHDAVHVAALNLQHLMLCELRGRMSRDLTGELSQLLEIHPRKAQRIVAGDQMLTIDEVVAVIPRTVAELFRKLIVHFSFLGGPAIASFRTFAPQESQAQLCGLIPSRSCVTGW